MIFGILLALLQLFIMLLICYYEAKIKSSGVFLWATLILMYGIMHTLNMFNGEIKYSYGVLNQSAIFVVIFEITYLLARGIKYYKNNKSLAVDFKYDNLKKSGDEKTSFIIILYIIIIIIQVTTLIRGAGGILNTSWGGMRSVVTERAYISSGSIMDIIYFMLGGISCYCIIKSKKITGLLIIVFQLFYMMISRNRILMLPVMVSIIEIFLFKVKKIRPIHVLYATLCAIFVIYIVYGVRVFRHYGTIQTFINSFDINDFITRINTYIKTDNGELGLRDYFYTFIYNNNNYSGFGRGATYLRMLLIYIPSRFSLGIKPTDFAVTMGQAMTGVVGLSIHPTIFGDAYANFGFFGSFLGFFWGCFINIADSMCIRKKSNLYKILCYCLYATSFVIIARGSVYNGVVYIAYGVPILLVLSYLREKFTIVWSKK